MKTGDRNQLLNLKIQTLLLVKLIYSVIATVSITTRLIKNSLMYMYIWSDKYVLTHTRILMSPVKSSYASGQTSRVELPPILHTVFRKGRQSFSKRAIFSIRL